MSARSQNQVLIVGAGISGLLAGQACRQAGLDVLVVDKGRGVGGRMATRRIEDARVDHGAQFFTANDVRFQERVASWEEAGIVVPWSRGFADANGRLRSDGRMTWRGAAGMSSLPKALAADLDVRTGVRVTALRSIGDGYEAVLADGGALRADHVLLTPPVPQTLALLAAGEIDLPAEQRACLERIRYDPCIALLVLLPEPSHVPAPGGLKPDSDVIAWVADNAQKGISPTVPAVTIHATAEFSRRHWDTDAAAVQRMLLEAAAPWLGSPPTTVQVHRWLYSQPHDGPGRPFLLLREAPSLLVAGDAFGPGAIEGAALSGLEAGAWLAARLGRA